MTFKIYAVSSLKEKRMIIKSIIKRCQNKYNASVIESGYNDKWQLSSIGFAIAAVNKSTGDQNAQNIIDFLYSDDRIEILNIEKF